MTHLYASEPRARRRRGTEPCAHCEATARGCDTMRWLRGQSCCPKCSGTHEGRDE